MGIPTSNLARSGQEKSPAHTHILWGFLGQSSGNETSPAHLNLQPHNAPSDLSYFPLTPPLGSLDVGSQSYGLTHPFLGVSGLWLLLGRVGLPWGSTLSPQADKSSSYLTSIRGDPKGEGMRGKTKIRRSVLRFQVYSFLRKLSYLTLHFTDEEVETQRVQLGLDLP